MLTDGHGPSGALPSTALGTGRACGTSRACGAGSPTEEKAVTGMIPSSGVETNASQGPSAVWPVAQKPRERKGRATPVGMTESEDRKPKSRHESQRPARPSHSKNNLKFKRESTEKNSEKTQEGGVKPPLQRTTREHRQECLCYQTQEAGITPRLRRRQEGHARHKPAATDTRVPQ
jgi:hypothetical protein